MPENTDGNLVRSTLLLVSFYYTRSNPDDVRPFAIFIIDVKTGLTAIRINTSILSGFPGLLRKILLRPASLKKLRVRRHAGRGDGGGRYEDPQQRGGCRGQQDDGDRPKQHRSRGYQRPGPEGSVRRYALGGTPPAGRRHGILRGPTRARGVSASRQGTRNPG